MKRFKLTRMFWIFVVSAATAALAILSGFLQYQESLKQNKDELDRQRELKDAYKTISEQSEKINRKSDAIIDLQDKHQIELKGKTDEIIALQAELKRKNELLITQQKESLNYLSGGNKLVKIVPSIAASSQPNDEIQIELYNQSKYPQHEINISIIDNFKYQALTKDYPKGKPFIENTELFNRLSTETSIYFYIDKLEARGRRIIYKTNLYKEFQEGFFIVRVESLNGEFTKTIKYKHIKNSGIWELENIEDYYKDIEKEP